MRRLIVACALAAAALVVAPSALALTKQEATRIALRALQPQKEKRSVVVFALLKPLKASQSVAVAGPRRLGYRKASGLRPVTAASWLFWADLDYGARFEHASKLVLVSDRSGKSLVRTLDYYPLVDGLRPPWLRSTAAYRSMRYVVWSNVKRVRRSASGRAAAGPSVLLNELPPNAFADDCLLMIGLYHDPDFFRDFRGMRDVAESVGLRTWYASQSGALDIVPNRTRPAGGEELRRSVSELVRSENCKDMFIYIDGHGAARTNRAGEGQVASVTTGEGKWVFPVTLSLILGEHPNITFKVKIDACYAGRFLEPREGLTDHPNLLVLEASSASNQVSYSSLNGLAIRDSGGNLIRSEYVNPGRGEFTNGNVGGLISFAESRTEVTRAQEQGGSLLARMIARSFQLGAASDRARLWHRTTPELYTNIRRPPPPPPPPPLAASVEVSHVHPSPNPGYSIECAKVTSDAGASLSLTATGPSSFSYTATALLASGTGKKDHTFSWRINSFGDYGISVTAQLTGQTATAERTYTVGAAAQGPFVCPTPP